ncbi:hypothetical protein BO70DRAFT_397436 [Aspergillus heteromorphus CBS 117.55]|uniref:MFS general substrate transporter n=1 Tax=Aspergillus heteromorphus CBS 117.55 TaxID=1448321 RepID=A0A317W0A4_9EURO|nr:uncharacterized protein BO70DRAFT_397436 [Aspergillus heteromorphus CBS 117.55]PWY79329.1 hypothetical protein BO70DRAFT_397436 [Aspergillus heteromorphus CBS 117.55]
MSSNASAIDVEKKEGREQVVQDQELNGSTKRSQHQDQGHEDRSTPIRESVTVDWDGLDDPENPMDWPTSRKTIQLVLKSWNNFITPLASSMFSPGIAYVMADDGRVPVYHVCNMIFLIFSIACAVAQNLPQLIVFRLLARNGGACPLAIESGTVADMINQKKRAGIMAVCGWRWVF